MASAFQLLHELPEELLQQIIGDLEKKDLTSFNSTSRWSYGAATPFIWRNVNLQDCLTRHEDGEDDYHDDTPLLRKLLILATRPTIAACVHSLTHRCHLPPPGIFHELPNTPFSAQTLSSDPRTAKLVQLAVKNMTKVQTLRIIFGHPNVNDSLLRCFFDKNRESSIRRLWLENCRIGAGCTLRIMDSPFGLPLELDFRGLESIRVRRLPLRSARDSENDWDQFVHARGGTLGEFQDGAGGMYRTTVNDVDRELNLRKMEFHGIGNPVPPESFDYEALEHLLGFANIWDDRVYKDLALYATLPLELEQATIHSHVARSRYANHGPYLDPDMSEVSSLPPEIERWQREKEPSLMVMGSLLRSCSSTLTSLCLDWILTRPSHADESSRTSLSQMFQQLFRLRFPNLRAFQVRNAVVRDTLLPEGCYLLDYSDFRETVYHDDAGGSGITHQTHTRRDAAGLKFIEAHPNLQCLAWPMDRFFSGTLPSPDIAYRVEAAIDNFGRTLIDLRVDVFYRRFGEVPTECDHCPNRIERESRRRFIAEFVSKMARVKSIKIEGGVPRDERREILRALHKCPLEKIVMIGVCCPIGNTWGSEGRDLNELIENSELDILEAEHKDSVHSIGFRTPDPPPASFRFEPTFGWPPGPPMIHTIASFHAETIKELKFCGYKGAPMLFTPTPITQPILAALKHFHGIEDLVLSMWLNTEFEGTRRDEDIIKYWIESQSPLSTSLVRITDEEPEGWEKELRTKFAPDALAWRITNFIGPFLSEAAKSRKGGVRVRISMSIGDGGIFDIDLQVGKGSMNSDVCLRYKGPRAEVESGKRQEKLEGRRWF